MNKELDTLVINKPEGIYGYSTGVFWRNGTLDDYRDYVAIGYIRGNVAVLTGAIYIPGTDFTFRFEIYGTDGEDLYDTWKDDKTINFLPYFQDFIKGYGYDVVNMAKSVTKIYEAGLEDGKIAKQKEIKKVLGIESTHYYGNV